MPIIISDGLPAYRALLEENVFVLNHSAALHQDIRPLRIAILNLMPNKIETELQLLRLLSNCALQVEITLLHTASHQATHTAEEHLTSFYKSFTEVREEKFDGLIITGAPVERLAFEDVDYWPELVEIMQWSHDHVYSTLHICWGAQAGLYHHYGVPKYDLPAKAFGVFQHQVEQPGHALVRGFDDRFYAPHSRHTEVRRADIEQIAELQVLCYAPEAGVNVVADREGRRFFVCGHFEYDRYSLHQEYVRDTGKGLTIRPARHYYPADDPAQEPYSLWKAHANLLFSNWLNYFVYQETPYRLEQIGQPGAATKRAVSTGAETATTTPAYL